MTDILKTTISFICWSKAETFLGWVFGMAVRIGLALTIAFVLLNPANPAYNPQARGTLDSQAQTIMNTGSIAQDTIWWQLLHSASAECHYRSAKPQEFMLSGTLPDEYIVPNSNAPRWYVRFPANMSLTLFGTSSTQAGVVSMQDFYAIVQTEGFKPCSAANATNARNLLGLN